VLEGVGPKVLSESKKGSRKKTSSVPIPLQIPDANLVLRSADLVDFPVHKSVLAMASPLFRELVSLLPDGGVVDGLPVVKLSEDAELLMSLISMLYPVLPVVPSSNDKGFSLLAACQKYEMVTIQSSIHVSCGPCDPSGSEAFRAYAIASRERLTQQMERAAAYTLEHPLTFEALGEELRLFEGWALRDLVSFRKRCRDNVVACLDSFLDARAGPSRFWVGCPDATHYSRRSEGETESTEVLPSWLYDLLTRNKPNIQQGFTHPLNLETSICNEFLTALQTHADCNFCLRVLVTKEGSKFCNELFWELTRARHKVRLHGLPFVPPRFQFAPLFRNLW
jgi:BTB/POZ domain